MKFRIWKCYLFFSNFHNDNCILAWYACDVNSLLNQVKAANNIPLDRTSSLVENIIFILCVSINLMFNIVLSTMACVEGLKSDARSSLFAMLQCLSTNFLARQERTTLLLEILIWCTEFGAFKNEASPNDGKTKKDAWERDGGEKRHRGGDKCARKMNFAFQTSTQLSERNFNSRLNFRWLHSCGYICSRQHAKKSIEATYLLRKVCSCTQVRW